MEGFKIYKDSYGLYSVLFKIKNKIVFFAEKKNSKIECYRTIKLIRRLSISKNAVKIQKTLCGSWFFYIINLNTNEILGESQTYINEKSLLKDLGLFKLLVLESKIDSEIYSL